MFIISILNFTSLCNINFERGDVYELDSFDYGDISFIVIMDRHNWSRQIIGLFCWRKEGKSYKFN